MSIVCMSSKESMVSMFPVGKGIEGATVQRKKKHGVRKGYPLNTSAPSY